MGCVVAMNSRNKGNGSVRQRYSGTWQLRYDGPPDESGLRKQINETIEGSRKEAERVLRERLSAIESGNYIKREKETVGQFLARWLDTYAASNVSPYSFAFVTCTPPFVGSVGRRTIGRPRAA